VIRDHAIPNCEDNAKQREDASGGGFNPPLNLFHDQVETLKAAIRIEEYASELTELRFGRGICPIHGGDNASAFAVYPEDQRWYCYRCSEGGDLIDLCAAVEGHAEKWTALRSLAQRFNVELPTRSEKWRRRQNEKAKVRKMLCEKITDTYQRRLFLMLGDAALEGMDDPVEREDEARKLFEGLRQPARYLATKRMERRHG